MVKGLDTFWKYFADYEEQYVLIGGSFLYKENYRQQILLYTFVCKKSRRTASYHTVLGIIFSCG